MEAGSGSPNSRGTGEAPRGEPEIAAGVGSRMLPVLRVLPEEALMEGMCVDGAERAQEGLEA